MTLAARHQAFFALHQSGCSVMPNPWDAGSARMMAALGIRRISLGSQVARVAHAAIRDWMTAMMGPGSFAPLMASASGDEIDALLRKGADDV